MTDIHSCSYFCTRPACVLAQRDELRDKMTNQAERVDKWLTDDLPQVDKEQAKPVVVIAPPAELKYVVSDRRMTWDDAVAWAAGMGMRLATVAEMREIILPPCYYWSGTEYTQSFAWGFLTSNGLQCYDGKSNALFAVAVAKQNEGNPSY
jgi:hypothetical protein